MCHSERGPLGGARRVSPSAQRRGPSSRAQSRDFSARSSGQLGAPRVFAPTLPLWKLCPGRVSTGNPQLSQPDAILHAAALFVYSRFFSGPLAQLAEQETLNLWVRGSSPWRVTNSTNNLRGVVGAGGGFCHHLATISRGGAFVEAVSYRRNVRPPGLGWPLAGPGAAARDERSGVLP